MDKWKPSVFIEVCHSSALQGLLYLTHVMSFTHHSFGNNVVVSTYSKARRSHDVLSTLHYLLQYRSIFLTQTAQYAIQKNRSTHTLNYTTL